MGTKKQKMFKVNKKHIILASVIGAVIIAAAVCGVLFAAKYNKDVAEEEKRRFEQLEQIAVDSDEANMQEDTETDQDEPKEDKNKDEEKKKDSESKDNKTKTENKSSSSTNKKENTKGNTSKKNTAGVTNCVKPGASLSLMRPTSKECNITLETHMNPVVLLNDLVGSENMKDFYAGTISNTNVIYGNNASGKVIRVLRGNFIFRTMKPGKADIVIWEELNKTPLLTMHVTVKAPSGESGTTPTVVELKKIKVTCPDRATAIQFATDNPNTWIDGGLITYEPSNATLKTDSTISIQPNDYISVRFGSYGDAAYSVQPRDGLQNVSGPITVTVKNGSISGSCTF